MVKKKEAWKPSSYPARIDINWSVSRARETEGYNVCTIRGDGKKIASSSGGGYDLTGAALSEWVSAAFAQELLPHAWMGRNWSFMNGDKYLGRTDYIQMDDRILTRAGQTGSNLFAGAYFHADSGKPHHMFMAEDENQFVDVMALIGVTADRISNSKGNTVGYRLFDEPNERSLERIKERSRTIKTHNPDAPSVLAISEYKFGQATHRVNRFHGDFLSLFQNAETLLQESLEGWGREGNVRYNSAHSRNGLDTWKATQDTRDLRGVYSHTFLNRVAPHSNTIATAYAKLEEL